jgi:hypothetical protein
MYHTFHFGETITDSNILHAFDVECVGTKVINQAGFLWDLGDAINVYTFPKNGQGFIPVPAALLYVSCGMVSRKGLTASDYVIREWCGQYRMFARRNHAPQPTQINAIVYTQEAYLEDPDLTGNLAKGISVEEQADRKVERERIQKLNPDYVLVAVLASAGEPRPQPSSGRFVANLAGGNARYALNPETDYHNLLATILEEAKAIKVYNAEWITVAD